MKKFQVVLSFLAMVIAFGGAMASAEFTTISGYEFVDGPVPQCIYKMECNPTGTFDCQVLTNTPVLQAFVSSTSCGTSLKHTEQPD